MTIASARADAQSLGPKAAGHLITSGDWNTLVGVLVEYGDALLALRGEVDAAEAAITELTTRVDALDLRVDGVESDVQAIDTQTAELRKQFLLKASTTSETVLVGQTAEIVFKATALDGSALAAPFPWLDVFASWGRLSGAPGFNVLENAEENALAIQFNAQGEARVRLRSHFTRGIPLVQETAFQTAMQAQTASGQTVLQVLGASASPQDPAAKAAFKVMHASYDASQNVQLYADSYVKYYTGSRYGRVRLGEWETYRATVMAFAKPDPSATTADPTRGVATVQVSFREWISNWSDDYVHTLDLDLAEWNGFFAQNLNRADLLPQAAQQMELKAPGGGLKFKRSVNAFEKSVDLINPGGDAKAAQQKQLLKGTAQAQQAYAGDDALAAKGYALQAQATETVSQMARAAQASAGDAASTKQAVLLLEGRVKAAESAGKEISAGLKNIGDGVNKINVGEVADLGNRLNTISLSLDQLRQRLPG